MNLLKIRRPEFWTWTPSVQLHSLRNDLDKLFESSWREWENSPSLFGGGAPALDLLEDKDNLVVKLELPGVRKEDVNIWFEDGVLNLAGERKPETKADEAKELRAERASGRFHRSLALPKPVVEERISATLQDGILTIVLPKAEEAKPKQVEIKVN